MPDNEQKNRDSQEPQPQTPGATESIGAPLPAPPVAKVRGEALKEKARLDNMGVKSDDDGVRGVNIVAQGHHVPDPVNHPRELPDDSYGEGVYQINEYGDTMPAMTLRAPKLMHPAPPPVPALTPPAKSDKK